MIRGRIIFHKEIPAAFIDNNSNLSPRFPNVINDPNRIDKGNASGIRVNEA